MDIPTLSHGLICSCGYFFFLVLTKGAVEIITIVTWMKIGEGNAFGIGPHANGHVLGVYTGPVSLG